MCVSSVAGALCGGAGHHAGAPAGLTARAAVAGQCVAGGRWMCGVCAGEGGAAGRGAAALGAADGGGPAAPRAVQGAAHAAAAA